MLVSFTTANATDAIGTSKNTLKKYQQNDVEHVFQHVELSIYYRLSPSRSADEVTRVVISAISVFSVIFSR